MALLLVVLVLANLLYHIDAELFSCGELWVITTVPQLAQLSGYGDNYSQWCYLEQSSSGYFLVKTAPTSACTPTCGDSAG
jgi:hypothetical protein